jgi:hypothetical protein
VSGDGAKLPDLVVVSRQERVLLAKEKLETALAEFEYCADSTGDDPRFSFDWNSGLALIALNRFDEGCARCLESLRKRLEEDFVNVDTTDGTKSRFFPAVVRYSRTNDLFS